MRRVTNNRYTAGRRRHVVPPEILARDRAEKVAFLTFVETEPRVAQVNARFPHNNGISNLFITGLVERDPADRGKFRVTAAGKAYLATVK